MEKEKLCLVAKEIIEKSYFKLKHIKQIMLNLMNFQLILISKMSSPKKLKNYPLDKDMDNLTISTWKNILPKLMDINIIYHV